MAKIKNASGNWLETLSRLVEIVKKEYPEGGKFPPVTEMSKRLHVAENTYCKALRAICKHGLAKASAGRGGTWIVPPSRRTAKIGILTPSMLSKDCFAALLRHTLDSSSIGLQTVDVPPEKLVDHLLVINVSALYAINPKPEYFPFFEELHKRGFPVAASEFFTYEKIGQASKYDFPYFHFKPDSVAAEVCRFADEKGLRGGIMQVDAKRNVLTEAFERVCSAKGRDFDERSFVEFNRMEEILASRVKQKSPCLLYAKCNDVHGDIVCEQLSRVPEESRPAVVFSEELREHFKKRRFPGVRILGYFKLEEEPNDLACAKLVEALKAGRPTELVEMTDFKIR